MLLPTFEYENEKWNKGILCIAGVDEVGRGSFAGPVVAGCVVFTPVIREFPSEIIINDSKKLTVKQRELADKWIRKNALSFGIGSASPAQINKVGIKKATEIAFRKAISSANFKHHTSSIEYLLTDAFYIPYVAGVPKKLQKPIIKGDCLSVSIAAASIIAKVYRDRLMISLSKKPQYKSYRWDKNKGYGAAAHCTAILENGTTRLHRKDFVDTWIRKYNK
jgi:ribonuclease HII